MSVNPSKTAAITGATGYLGGVIRRRLEADGWNVISLVRTPVDATGRRYVVGDPLPPDLFDGADVLVHCAYDMSITSRDDIWRVNVEGTRTLLDAASEARLERTIVLSSMSAYPGTKQLYGQSKLDIESDAKRSGAISVRPGLVYGPHAGGMAGTLGELTRLPVIPIVASRSHQFLVHEDDFAQAITAILKAETFTSEPVGLANPNPVTFRELIAGLARQKGRAPRFVPVDWRLVYRSLLVAEKLPVVLPFRADSLLGLARPAPYVPHLEALDELGLSFRRFNQPVLTTAAPDDLPEQL